MREVGGPFSDGNVVSLANSKTNCNRLSIVTVLRQVVLERAGVEPASERVVTSNRFSARNIVSAQHSLITVFASPYIPSCSDPFPSDGVGRSKGVYVGVFRCVG